MLIIPLIDHIAGGFKWDYLIDLRRHQRKVCVYGKSKLYFRNISCGARI